MENLQVAPLVRSTLLDGVAAELEKRILSGDIPVGTKLPSEANLAAAFEVSRPVVREALSKLRDRGLIQTVTGSGTYVRRPDADLLTDVLMRHVSMTVTDSDFASNLYEARSAIEVMAARLSAERATDGDIAKLRTHLSAMGTHIDDEDAWTASDLSFHLAIASSTQNPFFESLLAPLVGAIEHGIHESRGSRDAVLAGLAAHSEIMTAIEERDPDRAAEAMHHHLEESRTDIQSVTHGSRVTAAAPRDAGSANTEGNAL